MRSGYPIARAASNVTNMTGMFEDVYVLSGHVSSWNVTSFTTMSHMFNSARAFCGHLSAWNRHILHVLRMPSIQQLEAHALCVRLIVRA